MIGTRCSKSYAPGRWCPLIAVGHTRRCEKCLKRDRKYWKKNIVLCNNRRRIRRRTENPFVKMMRIRRYCSRYPERVGARMFVARAIRGGRLMREACSICGDWNSVAHHHMGYAREHWGDVQWLCPRHHLGAHGGSFAKGQCIGK